MFIMSDYRKWVAERAGREVPPRIIDLLVEDYERRGIANRNTVEECGKLAKKI